MPVYTLPRELHPDFARKNVKPVGLVKVRQSEIEAGLIGAWLLRGDNREQIGQDPTKNITLVDATRVSNYYNFNNNDNNIDTGWDGTGVLGSQNRTFLARVRTLNTSKQHILGYGQNNSATRWTIRCNDSFDSQLRVEHGAGNLVGTSTIMANGEWHVIAVRLDGSNFDETQLFIDGVQESTTGGGTTTINTTADATQLFQIGQTPSSSNNSWGGDIDFVYAYNRALTDAEILLRSRDDYYVGFEPATPIHYFTPAAAPPAGFEPQWAINANVILGAGQP